MQDGHLFIDRDGEIFAIILGYLRDGAQYPLPDDDYKLRLIEHEAHFYNLPKLAKRAERNRFYAQLTFAPRVASSRTYNSLEMGKSREPLPILATRLFYAHIYC